MTVDRSVKQYVDEFFLPDQRNQGISFALENGTRKI